ncbi:hypothetical protein EG327_009023 [Venturia inaequalis]|uniref:Uncharacterized protein n=1 Tax=Venturia inaequalis TaxID=5025 RepID=A0A8H3UQC5_VENIN|nr:hypothetical protein EG327_009023 [Venturia inaequalis]
MLTAISNFGNNAAGLEKALRLAQALCTIGASLAASGEERGPWLVARGQFNLSRRFFRLHKWIDHFSLAAEKLNNTQAEENAIGKLLDVTKNGFLGVYFFMEMGTITNVMGLTCPSWGPHILLESQKFWFYAIVTSLLSSFHQLLFAPAPIQPATPTTVTEKSSEKASPDSGRNNTDVYRQILIDGCDLFVPGAAVGWIPIESLSVGLFMSVSSVLAMGSMWPKIQAQVNAAGAKKVK